MQTNVSTKNRKSKHYADKRLFQGGSLRTFPSTFENWTFIFVHFHLAMPFLL
jgi:hypothetical protein